MRGARNCFGLRPSPWCPQKAAERHPILESRTLCAVLWTCKARSLTPRAAPLRRRFDWKCVRRALPAALATPRSLATDDTWTGSPRDCCFKAASTAGLEAIQVVFLNETSRPSSARAPKRALATRRPFAATCWGLGPQKSTDRSSTHVSAVATAFWLSTLLHAGQSATLLRATAKGQPARIPLLAKAGGPINPSAVKSLGPL